MENPTLRGGSFVMGGLFLGLWLYVDFFHVRFFGDINLVLWNFWGLIGITVAAGFYAAHVANTQARIVIWVIMGIAIGFLTMAAVFNQVGEAFAALFTIVGAGLIVTALPGGWNGPRRTDGPWQQADSPPRQ